MECQGNVVILGGTPRSGKTTLAVQLAKNGYSKISFDYINESIEKGLPEVIIEDNHNQECCAKKLYMFFETMVGGAVTDAKIYSMSTVIDMYDFTPEYVSKLPYQDSIEAYFLGYPDFNIDAIKYNIKYYAQPTDWIAQVDEEYLNEVAERCYIINHKLVTQCKQYGYQFVNTGAGEARIIALNNLYSKIINDYKTKNSMAAESKQA
jgi:adenylate kinase family enzyme